MGLARIDKISGRAIVVPGDDIDTDQIVPARFLKCVSFERLGETLFHDSHPWVRSLCPGPKILVSGLNFGCGSSREHAPQAIFHAGFRAIVAGSFADIFFGNSLALGIPCVTLASGDLAEFWQEVERDPSTEATITLFSGVLRLGSRKWKFSLPEPARKALLEGRWDPLGELLEGMEQARSLAARLPGGRGP